MARVKDNMITQGLSGNIDKQIVFKTRGNTTFTTSYPDMSKVIPTEKQLIQKSRFAKAVEYAKAIIADPIKKMEVASYTPIGKLVFHQAIKDYLKNNP